MSKSEPFIIENIYSVPIERVWRAITDKNEMKEWYFDLAEFKTQAGFEFQFLGGTEENQYLHLCKITEVLDGKKLTYSWQYEGYEGMSYVTFELHSEDDKTKLKLTHKGLETFPISNPDFAKENFVEGWNHFIRTSLKEFLKKSTVSTQ